MRGAAATILGAAGASAPDGVGPRARRRFRRGTPICGCDDLCIAPRLADGDGLPRDWQTRPRRAAETPRPTLIAWRQFRLQIEPRTCRLGLYPFRRWSHRCRHWRSDPI